MGKFSKNVTSSRRKQRKAHFSSHSNARAKLMSASLSRELQKKHGIRSLPIVKGDEVDVVRGSNKMKGAKVTDVYRKRWCIYVEGVTLKKANNQDVPAALHPSNVIIKKLANLDKGRQAIIDRKAKAKSGAAGKFTGAEIAQVD